MPRAKKEGTPSNIISITLTPEIHSEVKRLAQADERSVAMYVARIVRADIQRTINSQRSSPLREKHSPKAS